MQQKSLAIQTVLFLVFTILWVAPAIAGDAKVVVVGSELQLAEQTPIAEILSQPQSFAGQRVQVVGEVGGVCQRRGCWIDLSDAEGASLRVKVEDGVLVFPTESLGGEAVVEGDVEIEVMEREAYVAWQSHMAEDAGRQFDDSTVGDGPFEMVRLRGQGARLTVQPTVGD